jgi:hypothetical protein
MAVIYFNGDTFVGNMGQSLRFGSEDDEEDSRHLGESDDGIHSREMASETIVVSVFMVIVVGTRFTIGSNHRMRRLVILSSV